MRVHGLVDDGGDEAVPLIPVVPGSLSKISGNLPDELTNWIDAAGYSGAPGSVLLLPGIAPKTLHGVLIGTEGEEDQWSWGAAAAALPKGRYRIEGQLAAAGATRAAVGWALGRYVFARYKASKQNDCALVWPTGADRPLVEATAMATWLARDLINTPAADMGPKQLAGAAADLAKEFGAICSVTVGEDLITQGFPAIHAVGRAAAEAPRLIDLTWGSADHPKVTLVGKGVCFDSGGLDLKTASGMKLMKKDMGGAAAALGLARMIMATGLPVRLRVLIPAVENSVSGNAMRPLDVLSTRKGLTVEIGNTDAEGRLILADALTLAVEDKPDLLLDFATLTGAARAAVGTEIAAMFSPDDKLADQLARHGVAEDDPVWRMPLWRPYRRLIDSKVADINNAGESPYGGAITAALFLYDFVGDDTPWAHFDIMAWNIASRPGRPVGGEAMAMRAAYKTIVECFGTSK